MHIDGMAEYWKLSCVVSSNSYVWDGHLNPGYVQGMCDIVAPLLIVFDDGMWWLSSVVTTCILYCFMVCLHDYRGSGVELLSNTDDNTSS